MTEHTHRCSVCGELYECLELPPCNVKPTYPCETCWSLDIMSEYIPESIYDFPPIEGKTISRSSHRPNRGEDIKGKLRAWDKSIRPMEMDIYRYYGFPHFWPVLREAENPYLDKDEDGWIWVHEYNDPGKHGEIWHGSECDSFREAFDKAWETYRERFNDGKHILVYSTTTEIKMEHFEFRGRREGD